MSRRVGHEAATLDIQCLMADALKINVKSAAKGCQIYGRVLARKI